MLRVTEEEKVAPETGSPFDRTKMNFKYRAGGHETIPPREMIKSAFSFQKDIQKPDPQNFLKAKQGNGGKTNQKPDSKDHDDNIQSKQAKFQIKSAAVMVRPNPPDTELRR